MKMFNYSCLAFVFLALLEFIVVNYLWRKEYHRNMLSLKSLGGPISIYPEPTGTGTGNREIEQRLQVTTQTS
jgi:hypothetical protein